MGPVWEQSRIVRLGCFLGCAFFCFGFSFFWGGVRSADLFVSFCVAGLRGLWNRIGRWAGG